MKFRISACYFKFFLLCLVCKWMFRRVLSSVSTHLLNVVPHRKILFQNSMPIKFVSKRWLQINFKPRLPAHDFWFVISWFDLLSVSFQEIVLDRFLFFVSFQDWLANDLIWQRFSDTILERPDFVHYHDDFSASAHRYFHQPNGKDNCHLKPRGTTM